MTRQHFSVHGRYQAGAARHFILYPLAFIGAVVVVLAAIAALNYQPAATSLPENQTPVAGSSTKRLSPALQATFDRSCAVCHSQPATGAPASGNAEEWQPRLSQGIESLLEHTINGHNGMPPMGLCIECSQPEFVAFIEYMAQFDSGLECAE